MSELRQPGLPESLSADFSVIVLPNTRCSRENVRNMSGSADANLDLIDAGGDGDISGSDEFLEDTAPCFGAAFSSVQSINTRVRTMPRTHWTENAVAMDMMKAMSLTYAVPALQPRLTKFHGTCVPVIMLFYLASTEVGRLAVLDTFWKRIVTHPMIWQGLYCRDYGTKHCVWRTLEGRAGSEKCLCHMGSTHPAKFVAICKQITGIPGRSKEELMHSYCSWRADQKALAERNGYGKTLEDSGLLPEVHGFDRTLLPGAAQVSRRAMHNAAAASASLQMPWQVKAHSRYGLKIAHGVKKGEQYKKTVPVLLASEWRRRRPGHPPLRSFLQHPLDAAAQSSQ